VLLVISGLSLQASKRKRRDCEQGIEQQLILVIGKVDTYTIDLRYRERVGDAEPAEASLVGFLVFITGLSARMFPRPAKDMGRC
jgi:hypothetical protein